MDGFFSKIYDTQRSNSSSIFDRDINKFTYLGSPKSGNSKKSNKTFKQLLSEDYSDYLLRIKKVNKINNKNRNSQLLKLIIIKKMKEEIQI
jgi:hypothetical protein